MPPVIPMNKRKCSRDEAVPDSEGAKRLQTKQSHNLGPSHQRVEPDDDGNAAAIKQSPETMNRNESLEVPEDTRGESDRHREAETRVTKPGHKSQPARHLIEAMATEIARLTMDDVMGEIYCLSVLYPDDDQPPGSEEQQSILAYKASADPLIQCICTKR
eukprot:scaffold44736_cov62-Attheya_sp.AAC.1